MAGERWWVAALAQAPAGAPAGGGGASAGLDLLVWFAALGGALLLLGIIWLALRRWVLADDDPGPQFTLADLRDMRARGLMTADEFERAKASVVAREVESLKTPRAAARQESDRREGL